VRTSNRLIDSPCCLVLANGRPHGYVERLLREAGRDVPKSARILEINPEHPIVKNLEVLAEKGDVRVGDWIELLYDQALVSEGALLEDPNGFARRITSLLAAVSGASVAATERAGG
jgi:molecular chaperone HtpG